MSSKQSDVQQIEKPSVTTSSAPQPMLSNQIPQVFLPSTSTNANIVYQPYALGVVEVFYQSAKHKVATTKSYTFLSQFHDGIVSVDWSDAQLIEVQLKELKKLGQSGAKLAPYPSDAADIRNYETWKKQLNQYVRTSVGLTLLYSSKLKLVSTAEENEREFRIRLQHEAHEQRDQALDDLKKKYAARVNTLEDRLRRAQQAVEKQSTLANQKKMDAMVSTGTAIFSALFGSKKISTTSISRVGSAMKSSSKALKSGQGIEQAQETLRSVESQLEALRLELENQSDQIFDRFNVSDEVFEKIDIRATSTNISIPLCALAWVPDTV
jgi:uncharacterized membrane-anchored protein YhcB (DUF1043 family)